MPHALILSAGVLALLGCAVLSIGIGSGELSFARALRLLWSPEQGYDSTLVHSMRLPRTVLGIAAGAALAIAGALMQALTRNPLADPGIFGVNAGASATVVAAISTFGLTGFTAYVWFGFLGAAIASVATFLLGTRARFAATPMRLALAGTAVNAALTAFTNGFVYFDNTSFAQYRSWVIGSLNVPNATSAWQAVPFVAAGLLIALALVKPLNALALGEDTGSALGSKVRLTRIVGMGAIVLLCGATTAAVGPIAFVGLAVPHLVRYVTGPDYRLLIPYCLVFAPVLLLAADIAGRILLSGGEIQVAIMTALFGGPVFVLLARRRKLAQL
ncbi:ABC transporter permease [Prauserella marina]|uniref:Iron complex transport system permease protein n=1 Tax=Prauserella marina TaxID=530584 RepID=A0A222VTK3_9PSEU|nr:iron chelate uptake ABC transporter family permease subunit [Prauserella marina]ASR37265.1 ABC transporter permease [Prauserella marina]PWV72599.1 iron complex transport system permease protein [Prauserella marina]SDD76294.1 iron complex transport system permease protein [Prauserella marina]